MKELETSEYKVYQNENMNGFGHAYDTIYDGGLVGDVARYDITCVKNGITLSQMAAVSKEDAEEIKCDSISVVSERPEITSVQPLYKSIDYKHAVYHVGDYAKAYNFSKIPTIDEDFAPVATYGCIHQCMRVNHSSKRVLLYTSERLSRALESTISISSIKIIKSL